MSNAMYPRKFWGIPLWAVQLVAVGLRTVFFWAPVLVKYLGKVLWKWDGEGTAWCSLVYLDRGFYCCKMANLVWSCAGSFCVKAQVSAYLTEVSICFCFCDSTLAGVLAAAGGCGMYSVVSAIGTLVLLHFLLDVVRWTLLQHLSLRVW